MESNRQNSNMPLPENKQSPAADKAAEVPVSNEELLAKIEALKKENESLKLASDGEVGNRQIAAILGDVKRKPKVQPKNEPTEVRALRPGTHGGNRYLEGDVFVIEGPHKFGTWMEPTGKKMK